VTAIHLTTHVSESAALEIDRRTVKRLHKLSENATPIALRPADLERVLDVPFVPGAAARDSKHDAY
jgi:hypothetical protein